MRTPVYNTATRGLLVKSLWEHIDQLSDMGLELLQRQLPTDVFQGAHIFCEITGLRRRVKRAFLKHNVSIAYEVNQLLRERSAAQYAQTNGLNPGEQL